MTKPARDNIVSSIAQAPPAAPPGAAPSRTRAELPEQVPPERQLQRAIAHLRELSPVVEEQAAVRSAGRRDAAFRRLLVVADFLGAAVALAVVQLLTNYDDRFFLLYLGLPIVIVISKASGLYDREELVVAKTTLNEAPALFQLATLYTLLITVLAPGLLGMPLTTHTILAFWTLLFFGIIGSRLLARRFARQITPTERCLVLGQESQAVGANAKFSNHDGLHAQIVAYLPFGEFELTRPRATESAFASYIAERDIHRVIIASGDSQESVLEAVRYFKAYHLKVSVLPSLLDAVGSSVEFDDIHGTTLLGVRTFGLSRSSRILKRGFDVVGSSLFLVFGSPLFLAIALAIKLDSRGPVYFKQTRVGRDGRRFTVIKFRTMRTDAEQMRAELEALNETRGLFKLTDDPRVTRVGRFLRRHSLDELPQFLNVLRGEMSLVGPRPLVVEEDARVAGWQRNRLYLEPGITGAWQIMGSTRVPLEEMAVMDYLYIVNWSLWSDAKILLRTVRHVVGSRGL
jgi:exopolysaccharide biosynthesis polyprenyl glycosylphosphotransferase